MNFLKNIIEDLNRLHRSLSVVVGIDLSGSPKSKTGIAILKGYNVETYLVSEDSEIMEITKNNNPDLVSIDAPLSLPDGKEHPLYFTESDVRDWKKFIENLKKLSSSSKKFSTLIFSNLTNPLIEYINKWDGTTVEPEYKKIIIKDLNDILLNKNFPGVEEKNIYEDKDDFKLLRMKRNFIENFFPDDALKMNITRECDRILKKRGIPLYWTLLPSMINLARRGIKLAEEFRKNGFKVIESFPGAAQDILQIPRKKKDVNELKKGLVNTCLKGINENTTHDELDAITSALVGYFYLSHNYEALGNEDEGYLIIPDID